MAEKIAVELQKLNISVVIDGGNEEPSLKDVDKIIVLGGDGTILRAARQYARWQLPVLGVNMGTVGFLTNIEINELPEYMQRFIAGDYKIDERLMLEVNIYQHDILQKTIYCLNEVAIRSETTRMVGLNVQIDEQVAGYYRGDGTIIATPTGSTAYSLACGGPVADPDLEIFILTPIATNLVCKKPMIIAADRTLYLHNFECYRAIICMDGQEQVELQPDHIIQIKKAPFKFQRVDLKGTPFFTIVEDRLRRNEGIF